MESGNGFRYSVYETSTSSPAKAPSSSGGFMAAVRRLLCFGRNRRTAGLDPSLRLGSSASRMNLALAVAEQYVLISWDNPLDETEFDQAATVANTPTMQSSPMSGTSDGTLLHCNTAHLGGKSPARKRSAGGRRRSMAINSLLPKSMRLPTPQSPATASPPSYRSSTICDRRHRSHHSESHLDSCGTSPAMVAARENPLFC
ncbi:hypothetical protein GGF42_001646 [Coemansia sp. RSA 2424]|nr:hypothetical protein GGF42_001646 [Coemansia sp. RSA 2424]